MNALRVIVPGLLAAVLSVVPARAAGEWPKFDEVYQLLLSHLDSANEPELNRLAIEGLIAKLEPRALLLSAQPAETPVENPITRREVFEDGFGYVRFARIDRRAVETFQAAFQQLSNAHTLNGVVLDVRFADGTDYEAAALIADRFVATPKPLIDWSAGSLRATAKTDAISLPVVILVNDRTAGAAEALAAALREANAALLIGAATAGHAKTYQDLPLQGGHLLRVATGMVKVGPGKPLSEEGIHPDIEVRVTGEDEAIYFEDSYAIIARPGSDPNGPARALRRRANEAELVRQQRERLNPDARSEPVQVEDAPPRIVTDPALARALDLLKGITIVQRGARR